MAKIQRKYRFQNGTRADAEQVNEEFDNVIEGHNALDDEMTKKVDVDGDFRGTLKGRRIEDIEDPGILAGRVTAIEEMVEEAEKAIVTLVRGENTVEAPENASLSVMEIIGDEVKNLVTLFGSGLWSGTEATLNSPDKITIVADGTEKVYETIVQVVPNMTYFLSGITTLEGTHIEAVVSGNTIQAPNQVVVPQGVTSVTVKCVVTNIAQGTATFEQVQLSVSDVEREFVAGYQPLRNPYIEIDNGSYLYFDEYLYKEDKLYQDTQGNWRKKQNKIETFLTTENVKTVTVEHYTGGKALKFLVSEIMPSASTFDQEVLKWNGMYFTRSDSSANQTNNRYYLDATHLILFVAASDTGWGDKPADPTDGSPIPEAIPSKQEVLAFLQGWKMAHNDGTTPYIEADVSTKGAKKWTKIMGIGESTALPQESYFGWKPFKVIYKTSSEQDVPAKHEGALRLIKGENKIILGEGLVLREKANPVLFDDKYYIGSPYVIGSQTKYPISNVLEVSKQGKRDNWELGEDAQLDKALFDSRTSYKISYKVKNLFEFSCHVGGSNASHTVNFHMESNKQVKDVQEIKNALARIGLVVIDKLGEKDGVALLNKDGFPLRADGTEIGLRREIIIWKDTTTTVIKNGGRYTKKISLPIGKHHNVRLYFLSGQDARDVYIYEWNKEILKLRGNAPQLLGREQTRDLLPREGPVFNPGTPFSTSGVSPYTGSNSAVCFVEYWDTKENSLELRWVNKNVTTDITLKADVMIEVIYE